MKNNESGARIFLLRQLKLYGLDHLDAVILAALADERPMLLIGPHGTGKSELLNTLARMLGTSHRHYNASLICFDDLLGYPMPEPGQQRMKFIQTEATVWGAESVFIDEISRCRPEIANKLFSLIYERRLQGQLISGLRYRWSAMNPPPTEDDMDSSTQDLIYNGSLPLDPALADRFVWVVPFPAMWDMSIQARKAIVENGGTRENKLFNLNELIAATRRIYQQFPFQFQSWVEEWVVAVTEAMTDSPLKFSGRRCVYLRESVRWIYSAMQALNAPLEPEHAALEALRFSIPQRAQGMNIAPELLAGLHRKACKTVSIPVDSPLRNILAERDPIRRILQTLPLRDEVADRMNRSQIITDALAELPKSQRYLLSILLSRHPDSGRLNARAIELIAVPMSKALEFSAEGERRVIRSRTKAELWDNILATIMRLKRENDPDCAMIGNMLMLLFESDETDFDPDKLVMQFRYRRELFEPERYRGQNKKAEVAA